MDSKSTIFCGIVESEKMKIEKFIKKQKSRTFIGKIVTVNESSGVLAQLIRVP